MNTYVIVIKGTVSPALVASIDGFTVDRVEDGYSYLRGPLIDQAQLMGTVAQLQDYTAQIISINPEPPIADCERTQ